MKNKSLDDIKLLNRKHLPSLVEYVLNNKEACADYALDSIRSDKEISALADILAPESLKDDDAMIKSLLFVGLTDLVEGAKRTVNIQDLDKAQRIMKAAIIVLEK